MAQFNADIALKVNSSPAERQIRKVERAVEKVERASRDILGIDKQIVGERKKLLRLSGDQASRAKKRIADLRLQRTELGLQRRELQGIARLEKQRSKQLNSSGRDSGGGVNPVLLGAGAAAAARMSPARAFKQGDVVGQLRIDRNRISDALDAIEDEVQDGTAALQRSLTKYRATVSKFGAGSSQARMSRNVGVRPKIDALRDSKFQQIYASGRLRDIDTTIDSITSAQSKLTRQASRAASPINALGKQLLFTAGAYFTFDTAIRAVNASARSTAEIQRLEIALKAIVGTDTPKALNAIARAVEDFNIPLRDATRNFTQLSAAGLANGNSVEELETLYRGLAAATKATGGDAEDLNGVLRAATQVLSKSKVQAEELRGQIGDRLPGAFQLFAEATGRSAKELDKALKDGEVSAEEFVTKFGKFIEQKFEPAAKKIGSSPAEAGARLQKTLDDLNRAVGPALAELGAKFQDFASSVLKALIPVGEELARIFNIGQTENLKAYQESLTQLTRLDAEITKTEKRLADAEAAGQSDFALLGIQENLDSLNRRRQRLLKQIALQNASLGVNESQGTQKRTEQDTDVSTFDRTFKDAAKDAAEREKDRARALRDQEQLLERLQAQLKLENSSSEQERLVNQLLLDQLEIRQDINNKLEDADESLKDLINREAELRAQQANGTFLRGVFENAGSNMGAALAEKLPEAKTELTEIEQLVNNIGSTVTDGMVRALELAVTETDRLGEAMRELASDILLAVGRALILNAITSGINALGQSGGVEDGIGLFSILSGNFGKPGTRAEGGPVLPDRPYLVGEEGPELVVPTRAGTVIPADMTAAMARYSSTNAGSPQSGADGSLLQPADMSEANVPLNFSFNTVRIADEEFVSRAQLEASMVVAAQQGAKGGEARALAKLRNSPAARRRVGM